MNQETRRSQVKYAVAAFLGVLLFVIIYKYTLNQLGSDGINDLKEHTWHAEDIYLDRIFDKWLKRPYLFWHLCVKGCIKLGEMPTKEAAAFVHASFAMITHWVTFFLMDKLSWKISGKDCGSISAVISCILGLVQPMYVYWFNTYQYEGQFSINPIFNPTHMAVKPFGILCFMLAADLLCHLRGKEFIFWNDNKGDKSHFIWFSIFLFLSSFTKPTFMYMLLPAGVIYVLMELFGAIRKKEGSWKKIWNYMWKFACASIPALLYLLVEYVAFYFWGGTNDDAEVAIYPFLTAWHIYSPNVPKSLLLSMAFPFWMVLTNLKYFVTSVEGKLSILCYAVGTLEFSFFVETGFKLSHLNFSWPMMSGMLLLWIISGVRLVTNTMTSKASSRNVVGISIGCGLYYINPYQYII